ncbi:MAG TPA: ATP synthase F1 subunit delta [Bacillota bacterium]|nr:ATP synthase F1 subunit delta [Bacillota bacterium]
MSVARPYARALYAAATEAGAADAVMADLEATADLLASSPDVTAFLNHPAVGLEPKQDVLREAFGPRVHALTLRFLLLLLEKRRFGFFSEILQAYRVLAEDAAGTSRGRVEAARPLLPDELAALEKSASRWAGHPVKLVADVRPELLGGARIILGDRVIDGTTMGQLEALSKKLRA